MARITDINRIKRLKDSTMKLVVEKGFGGASAAMIAIDAKVASGYFYMHYKGKYEMVNSLLQEVFQEAAYKLDEYLKTEHSFIQIVEEIVDHIFLIAEKDPVKLKFLYVLSNDYSFVIDDEIRLNVFNFLKRLKELGQESNSIDPEISEEDLYLLLLVNSIQYINLRFKFFSAKGELTHADKEHLLYLIQKVLIQNS
ncbi:MAG: TetR/AcrR family transcriptional regulator [Bacteroidales bacterium]|jgi:AcrR family transcriptional regulator|nr:TetR/AcrR family transcriptional regulator [Bacteroidales bacterium]